MTYLRKIKLTILTFFLLGATPVFSQSVSLTGTVTDTPDNQTWNNGTITFTFFGPQGGSYRWTGGTLNPNTPITGSLTSSGTYSLSIPDNNQIFPIGSQWKVTVCPAFTPPAATGCFITYQTITGNAQTLNLTPASPRFQVPTSPTAIAPITAYADSEIVGGWIGFNYYSLTASAIRNCITVSAAGCTTWSQGSGITPGVSGSNLFYANQAPYNAKFDVQYVGAFTVANGSTTVTSGANDPAFVLTDATSSKIIFGNCPGDTVVRCPPQGTITAFNSAHSVSVSNAPANPPGGNAVGGFGHDDTTPLQSAFNAALFNGCVILPSGNSFFSAPPFVSTAALPSGIFYGYPACVIGQHTTNLTPLPNMNVSSCNGTQLVCFFFFNNAQNTTPNFSLLKDFVIFTPVINGYPLTGNFAGYTWVSANRVMSFNFWIWNLGGSLDSGIQFTGPNYMHGFSVFNTGSQAGCKVVGTGGTSSGANQMTTMEQSYCKSAGPTSPSVTIGTNAALRSFGGQFDTAQGASATVINDGVFDSYGEVIFNGGGAQESVKTTANGKTYLHGNWVIGQNSNTQGAVGCSASGGNVFLEASNIDGGTGGVALRNVTGCTINIGPGNNFIQGTYSFAGPVAGITNTAVNALCATGNFALTSGWGTSSVTSVAANGNIQGCHVTITGAAGAAGPVLTWTYPAVPIVAPGSCHLSGASGTLTGVSTGTPGTTSVAFTFTGTPSAQTYIFDVGCP